MFVLAIINTSVMAQYDNGIKESIELELNSDILLTGEYLKYQLTCLDDVTKKKSRLSKIAYVQLVDKHEKSYFSHKLKLDNGVSSGLFFLPTSLSTGNYKLIGYTKLMGRTKRVFEVKNVYIINQFVPVGYKNKDEQYLKLNRRLGDKVKQYNQREKVEVSLRKTLGEINSGNYLLSARKVNEVKFAKSTKVDNMRLSIENGSSTLPEIRGEIISGQIIDSKNAMPIANVDIVLSIPGADYIIKNVKSNNKGRFNFLVSEEYDASKALIQVLNYEGDCSITLDETKITGFQEEEFEKFGLDISLKKWLLKRSIFCQIENSYKNFKNDTIIPSKKSRSLYYEPDVNYVLDNYTRFSTVEEVFKEVIEWAKVRKEGGGYRFGIYDFETNQVFKNDLKPLLLLDGVMIEDENIIVNYPAKKIKSIAVVNKVFFNGASKFEGVIDIKTFNAEFKIENRQFKNGKVFQLKNREDEIKFYKQVYNNETDDSRIPDYRLELLWEPNYQFGEENDKICFFTSDVTGLFEFSIIGYSETGKRVEHKEYFYVH